VYSESSWCSRSPFVSSTSGFGGSLLISFCNLSQFLVFCPPLSRKFIAFTGEHLRSRLGSRVLETAEVINLVAQVSLLRDRRFLLAGRSCDVDIKMQHLQCDMGNVLDFDDVPTPVKPG
jgi:hypothetical protein